MIVNKEGKVFKDRNEEVMYIARLIKAAEKVTPEEEDWLLTHDEDPNFPDYMGPKFFPKDNREYVVRLSDLDDHC